jgi:ferrous iron transport protein B
MLTPFMSCSAKLPIYALFTAAFFPKYQALVMISLYVIGIMLGILSVFLVKKIAFEGSPVPFVMELPNYRFPSLKTVLLLVWNKARSFVQRAFTIILLATIAIWFLQSFDFRLNMVVDGAADSMLATIGRFISAVFIPLGFPDWRVSTALMTGFMAKEVVISTLAVLTGASIAELGDSLHTLFTPRAAFSFLVFTLLYTPCVAAVSVVKRELGNWKGTTFVILYQTLFAWLMAFCAYQAGGMVMK